MFYKFARATPLGVASLAGDRLVKTGHAPSLAGVTAAPSRSYYLDGAAPIDVRGIIAATAEKYAISPNPSDYLFEAIRAHTSQAPNDNHDGFTKAETLRFDVRAGRAVYQTYVTKPHHVNHRAENPKAARGVILDAHYNDDSPLVPECPSCGVRTAERASRDESGLHCRCGALVKDEFTEILVGIDSRKDPLFADGVRRGALNAGSMGCNCDETRCNACGHIATTRAEFCQHIRSNKGQLFYTDGYGDLRLISPAQAHDLMRRAGLKFNPVDFCWADLGAGVRTVRKAAQRGHIRKAFEYCLGVTYDEYSRVDTPADPKALQIEMLRAARRERQRIAARRLAHGASR